MTKISTTTKQKLPKVAEYLDAQINLSGLKQKDIATAALRNFMMFYIPSNIRHVWPPCWLLGGSPGASSVSPLLAIEDEDGAGRAALKRDDASSDGGLSRY